MLTDIIPAAWRKRVYAIYAAIGLALGIVQTVYLSTATAQPGWLTTAFAVFALVGTAFGLVANQNVTLPGKEGASVADPTPTPVSTYVIDGVTSTKWSDGSTTND